MDIGETKTVILPCYAVADFDRRDGGRGASSDYELWRQAAQRTVASHLAAGYAVELVSVRRREFKAWLVLNAIEDSLQARLDYVRASRTAPRRTVRLRARSAEGSRKLAS